MSDIKHAKDLDDAEILRKVEAACIARDCWANTWDIHECFYPEVPFKVVAAKLSKLLRRDLLTGCDCGCRGDWELTTKGRELAGISPEWRENPVESMDRMYAKEPA